MHYFKKHIVFFIVTHGKFVLDVRIRISIIYTFMPGIKSIRLVYILVLNKYLNLIKYLFIKIILSYKMVAHKLRSPLICERMKIQL